MKNFTNLINSLISEKRSRSASKLLENACGCAAVEIPKRVPMGLLKLIKEENDKFSPEKELCEEVHCYKGEEQFTYLVDCDGFHHHDEEEARAYLCVTRAQYKYAKSRI